ncbi:DUF2194 domain-containing protein [Clostridium felsineum]|uniref:Uncharacterized protein n=1 Tax=Clostridium felsineum TaxID=36839 RepID=A0A1S8LIB7_9CLOT|nr:DUF2194 domain-containing protein [Clostridium felsineum]URZ05493.1 hypothetical protein CLROS_008190 [Clostridium felsineum]URZ10532.1 hypothetical protein CROST_012420 [Clostridium felsineum]
MNVKRNIKIIIALVLGIAVFFQVVRLNFVMNFLENNNNIKNKNVYSSSKIPANVEQEKFLILFDKNEQNSSDITQNIKEVLKYMKKRVVVQERNDIQNVDTSYRGVVLTFENIDGFKGISSLMDYAKNGGYVLFAERPIIGDVLPSILSQIGVKNVYDIEAAEGIELTSNVLIKGKGSNFSKKILTDSSLKVELKDTSQMLLVSDNKIPILWQTNYGTGKIMMYNGTILAKKNARGIIAGAIGMLIPDYIYPVIDAKLTYIDDFPAPIPGGTNSTLYKEYGISTADFYRKVWWPDVLKISKLYNLKYTGLIIEDYNNRTTPPFITKTSNSNDFLLYATELLKNNGELGLHGYNHQSLAPKNYIKQPLGYNSWANEKNMERSIEEAIRYSSSLLKNYKLRVYVPPSNILSPLGRKALLKAMPDLKIISSVYNDDYYKDSYVQEFEIKDGIYELPRLTSGYEDNEENIWAAYNGITSVGVFSHFIHPDDVLDIKRSGGKGWQELSKGYSDFMKDVYKKFTWLPPVTASEGANLLKSYTKIEPFMKYKSNAIDVYCRNFQKGDKFILRTNKNIYTDDNCAIEKIDTGTYLVTANKDKFSINFK